MILADKFYTFSFVAGFHKKGFIIPVIIKIFCFKSWVAYSVDYKTAYWDQDTFGDLQFNDLYGYVKAYWGIFSGTGLGIFQWTPCELTCHANLVSFLK